MSLAGKTILMSGGSRGIGLAIALKAAADGANIAMLAKTDTPHPKLEGTVHTAAEAIRAAGGQALPIVGDVRDDDDITEAVLKTAGEFGGIDIVINNASVIDLSRSLELGAKKYDLMQDVKEQTLGRGRAEVQRRPGVDDDASWAHAWSSPKSNHSTSTGVGCGRMSSTSSHSRACASVMPATVATAATDACPAT